MSLLLEGRSYREIGAITACSQTTIRTAKRVIDAEGLPLDRVRRLTDAEIAGLFPDGRSRVKGEYDDPDFARVVTSFKKNQHFTLLQGWRSYTSRLSVLRKYGYSQYCALFNAYVRKHDLTAVLKHEPGKTMFIDWAGDTIDLVDAITGTITKAYLFVTVLPYSGYLWCRAFTDMRMPAWITAHVGAFEFYGGVPQLIIPDYVPRNIIRVLCPVRLCAQGVGWCGGFWGCAPEDTNSGEHNAVGRARVFPFTQSSERKLLCSRSISSSQLRPIGFGGLGSVLRSNRIWNGWSGRAMPIRRSGGGCRSGTRSGSSLGSKARGPLPIYPSTLRRS